MARKIEKSDAVEVSLLPEDQGGKETGARFNITAALWVILALVVAVFGAVAFYLRMQAGSMQEKSAVRLQEIKVLENQIGELQKTVGPLADLGRRIGLAKTALNQHGSGFPLMGVLEATAIPEVMLKQLNVDAKGTVVLTGRGKTIAALIRQIMAWDNHEAIQEVRISGVSNVLNSVGEVEGVEFTAALLISPALFTPNAL